MEKFLENLYEAERIIRAVDHMTYITFPLIKEKKLLIKIIMELKKALIYCINAILQYEYVNKRIQMAKEAKTNFQTFVEKSSKRFNIEKEEIKKILEIFELVESHKQSSMEFGRWDKVVILSPDMRQNTITLEKIKDFVLLAKNLLKKTRDSIKPAAEKN